MLLAKVPSVSRAGSDAEGCGLTDQPNLSHRGDIQNVWITKAEALGHLSFRPFQLYQSTEGAKERGVKGFILCRFLQKGMLAVKGKNDLG